MEKTASVDELMLLQCEKLLTVSSEICLEKPFRGSTQALKHATFYDQANREQPSKMD